MTITLYRLVSKYTTVQCTLYIVRCYVTYSVHCTLYGVHIVMAKGSIFKVTVFRDYRGPKVIGHVMMQSIGS